MGLYTTIYLAAEDSCWAAPVEIIRAVAEKLQVTKFDSFSVSREMTLGMEPADDDEDNYEDIFACSDVPIEEALRHHQAGGGYCTHMMFPFGGFMKRLAEEIRAAIPESIADGYIPWDTSISNGRWSAISYDEGTILDSGSFAFHLHANGCPRGLDRYLQEFLTIEGVKELKASIELLAQQPFKTCINLS